MVKRGGGGGGGGRGGGEGRFSEGSVFAFGGLIFGILRYNRREIVSKFSQQETGRTLYH